MIYLVAFAGGLLTIVSPCILPVLPFLFTRAGLPFRRAGLPMLVGMALSFAVIGSLAAVAGDWIVRANQYGRVAALVVFAGLGVTLLVPSIADAVARPFVRLGSKAQREGERHGTVAGSLLLGLSAGLLWTPCAGPILGLIFASAAVAGASPRSALLLLVFACGAATALALGLFAGGRVFAAMKRSLGAEAWIRRGLGMAVLLGVVGIFLGWDTGVLARLSLDQAGTATGLEQQLVDRVRGSSEAPAMQAQPAMMMRASAKPGGNAGIMPPLDGAIGWLNGPPLTREALRGRVVLVDFWTYSCINCLRAIPYVRAWADKYKDHGLVVIGVHTPEFAFERSRDNVARATRDLHITYPVAIDSDRAIWTAFNNQYWPAHYLIGRDGTLRFHHFGEGQYDETERMLQQLLAEGAGERPLPRDVVHVAGTGVEAAPDLSTIQSPETYVGYERQENYASPQPIVKDRAELYTAPTHLQVNQWGFGGRWTVAGENATLAAPSGRIVFRFHARDLHLVLGPGAHGAAVRFRVSIDGAPPRDDRGADVDSGGSGTVTEYRLYQLVRQKGDVRDRTLQIEFLDPGVQAFAFTFG